jgi:hypothetical protein
MIEATRLKVLGMATTKEITTPKHGAKRCRVTFRTETNVPRSFPVNRTNTKGKKSCIVSSESQSILSNHRRNDEPKAKIKARLCFAAFFWARRSSFLDAEVARATGLVDDFVSIRYSAVRIKRTTTKRRSQQAKPSAMNKDGQRTKHKIPENAGPNKRPLVTSNMCKRKDLKRAFAATHESKSEAKRRRTIVSTFRTL